MKDGREVEGSKNVATAEPYMMEQERRGYVGRPVDWIVFQVQSGDAIGFLVNQGRRGGGKCL